MSWFGLQDSFFLLRVPGVSGSACESIAAVVVRTVRAGSSAQGRMRSSCMRTICGPSDAIEVCFVTGVNLSPCACFGTGVTGLTRPLLGTLRYIGSLLAVSSAGSDRSLARKRRRTRDC